MSTNFDDPIHRQFIEETQPFINDVYDYLEQTLKHPRTIFVEEDRLAAVVGRFKLDQARPKFDYTRFQFFPGLYLLFFHPMESVRAFAGHITAASHIISLTDHYSKFITVVNLIFSPETRQQYFKDARLYWNGVACLLKLFPSDNRYYFDDFLRVKSEFVNQVIDEIAATDPSQPQIFALLLSFKYILQHLGTRFWDEERPDVLGILIELVTSAARKNNFTTTLQMVLEILPIYFQSISLDNPEKFIPRVTEVLFFLYGKCSEMISTLVHFAQWKLRIILTKVKIIQLGYNAKIVSIDFNPEVLELWVPSMLEVLFHASDEMKASTPEYEQTLEECNTLLVNILIAEAKEFQYLEQSAIGADSFQKRWIPGVWQEIASQESFVANGLFIRLFKLFVNQLYEDNPEIRSLSSRVSVMEKRFVEMLQVLLRGVQNNAIPIAFFRKVEIFYFACSPSATIREAIKTIIRTRFPEMNNSSEFFLTQLQDEAVINEYRECISLLSRTPETFVKWSPFIPYLFEHLEKVIPSALTALAKKENLEELIIELCIQIWSLFKYILVNYSRLPESDQQIVLNKAMTFMGTAFAGLFNVYDVLHDQDWFLNILQLCSKPTFQSIAFPLLKAVLNTITDSGNAVELKDPIPIRLRLIKDFKKELVAKYGLESAIAYFSPAAPATRGTTVKTERIVPKVEPVAYSTAKAPRLKPTNIVISDDDADDTFGNDTDTEEDDDDDDDDIPGPVKAKELTRLQLTKDRDKKPPSVVKPRSVEAMVAAGMRKVATLPPQPKTKMLPLPENMVPLYPSSTGNAIPTTKPPIKKAPDHPNINTTTDSKPTPTTTNTVPVKRFKPNIPTTSTVPPPSAPPKWPAELIKRPRDETIDKHTFEYSLRGLQEEIVRWPEEQLTVPESSSLSSSLPVIPDIFSSAEDYKRIMLQNFYDEIKCEIREKIQDLTVQKISTRGEHKCVLQATMIETFLTIGTFKFNTIPNNFANNDVICIAYKPKSANVVKKNFGLGIITNISEPKKTIECLYLETNVHPINNIGVVSDKYMLTWIMNLTTAQREYQSLMTSEKLLLFDGILHPLRLMSRIKKQVTSSYQITIPEGRYPSLNVAQRKAIQDSVHHQGFHLIQGPPGTGKTKTILALLDYYLHTFKIENSVPLVCAPSNAAVDEIIQRFSLTYTDKQLVRIGHPERVTERAAEFTLDNLVKREIARIHGKDSVDRVEPLERTRLQIALLRNASAIFCTLSGSDFDLLWAAHPNGFETVIIDEACQAVEVSTLIPLKYNCRRCILVGDPQQLPPTTRGRHSKKTKYDRSLFDRFIQVGMTCSFLDTQYRMHPFICKFCSAEYYQNRLITDPSANYDKDFYDAFPAFSFFDVRSQEEKSRNGYKNKTEVKAVGQILTTLSAYDQFKECTIGIITPYNEQCIELHQFFRSDSMYSRIASQVEISSVDGFQGREKDIIIFSCVRTRAMGFLDDSRRLNVALTRGKYAVYIVGDSTLLKKSEMWAPVIKYAKDTSNENDEKYKLFFPDFFASKATNKMTTRPAPNRNPTVPSRNSHHNRDRNYNHNKPRETGNNRNNQNSSRRNNDTKNNSSNNRYKDNHRRDDRQHSKNQNRDNNNRNRPQEAKSELGKRARTDQANLPPRKRPNTTTLQAKSGDKFSVSDLQKHVAQ